MGKRFIDPQEHWPGHCVHCGCTVLGGGDICPSCGEKAFEPKSRLLMPEEIEEPAEAQK